MSKTTWPFPGACTERDRDRMDVSNSHKNTSHFRLRPHCSILGPYLQIQSHWGVGLQHLNFEGNTPVHNTSVFSQDLPWVKPMVDTGSWEIEPPEVGICVIKIKRGVIVGLSCIGYVRT